MLNFECPKCGEKFEAEDDWLDAKVSCATCKTRFFVPENGQKGKFAPPKKQQPVVIEEIKDTSYPPNHQVDNKIIISFDDIQSPTLAHNNVQAERKLSPRQRRLMADKKMMQAKFTAFRHISMVETVGNPPEKYIVDYHVKGIERVDCDRIIYRNSHRVEIKLPGTYPRTPPACRMLTPIFHPNIEPAVICVGDHWTAGERLCDLVVRIGEIITYQSHNIKSPLDGEAAMWTDLHMDMLPIDNCNLMPPDNE